MRTFTPANSFSEIEGKDVVIVAGGPSARNIPLVMLKEVDAIVIAVNNAGEKLPWADFSFTADRTNIVKRIFSLDKFQGKVVVATPELHSLKQLPESTVFVRRSLWREFVSSEYIRGGNSGLAAYEFAVKNKASRIFLIGCDCADWQHRWYDDPDKPQGGHNNSMKAATISRWNNWPETAPATYNLSLISKITRFPKITWEQFLSMVSRKQE